MKKGVFIIIVLLGLFALDSSAQDQNLIKRTKRDLQSLQGQERGQALQLLGYHYSYFNPDSALKYNGLAIKWGQENQNEKIEYYAKASHGIYIFYNVHLDSSTVYLENLIDTCREKGLNGPAGRALMQLSRNTAYLGDREKSDSVAQIGIQILKNNVDQHASIYLKQKRAENLFNIGNSAEGYAVALEAKEDAYATNDSFRMASTGVSMSYTLHQANPDKAISELNQSLLIAKKIGAIIHLFTIYETLWNVYWQSNRPEEGYPFLMKMDSIVRTNNPYYFDNKSLYSSLGVYHYFLESPESSLPYFKKAAHFHNPRRNTDLKVYYMNLGEVYFMTGNLDSGKIYMDSAWSMLQKEHNLVWEVDLAEHQLMYSKQVKNFEEALIWQERLLTLKDSLNRNSGKEALENAQKQFEEEKQLLVDEAQKLEEEKEARTRKVIIISAFMLLVLSLGGLYSRFRFIRKSKATLQTEKDRSDNLLLNILPQEIAEELKNTGASEAKDFEQVTVLFSDFKEFTQTAKKLSAKELVGEINTCFKAFDDIMHKYKIEKIKTIGDAYMAAGGLHEPKTSEPEDVVKAGIEMQEFIINRKKEQSEKGLPAFDMRVGIHTGPVVAGIVGIKKFQYDIWGDTVNTAARMESHGEIAKVNISNSTYEILKDNTDFQFESRGKSEVKGLGETEMWFVTLKGHQA